MQTKRKFIMLCLFIFSIVSVAFPQMESPGAAGKKVPEPLFKIERSRDVDKIYYQVNLTPEGTLHPSEPVTIFWKRYAEDGRTEPLTRLQRNRSYGLKYKEINAKQATFNFAAFNDRTFTLKEIDTNTYRVLTQTPHRERELVKMYIHFSGGSIFVPLIGHITFYLRDTSTGMIETEIVTP